MTETPKPTFFQLMAAEFLGTYVLVYCGCGSVVINDVSNGTIGHAGIALTWGLVVLAMIYSIGEVSGAHINPAVSIGFWAARRFPGKLVLPYILIQCIAAIAASATLWLMFPGDHSQGETVPAGPWWQSFVLELILTAILMFVILNVSTGAKEKGITAGVVVGAVIALEAMFAGPICGASMNPARSLGPAIFSGELAVLPLYVLAPISGALLSIVGYWCVRGSLKS
jgi:aquaporin Z